jgi:lysozyme family protein
MAKVAFTPALKAEYERLFNSCIILPKNMPTVETLNQQLIGNRARYQSLGNQLGIPWFFIAVIHNMEASQNFKTHLHNGDPLTARTVQVPKGRPVKGDPPFRWEESAADALAMRGLGAKTDWSLAGVLYQLEGYNGWGYRLFHTHVLTPYLWSFSNCYNSGKYVADGTWSDTAVSKQCGAAVLIRRLAEVHQIDFSDQPEPTAESSPLIVSYATTKSSDPLIVNQAENLQRWLNGFPGIFVKLDGVPGEKTSTAYRRVTGSYLPGDPRS